jgi:Spy/CpxP family protein refolding chaperone
MRTKIWMVIALMGISAALVAQPIEKGKDQQRIVERDVRMKVQKDRAQGLNLTEEQREAFKKSAIELHKQLLPLKNELGELEAHQRTLVTAEKPDMAAISKNIEKIGSIRVEMAKIQVKHRVEMRSRLTDEQRLKFDMSGERRKMDKNPGKRLHPEI